MISVLVQGLKGDIALPISLCQYSVLFAKSSTFLCNSPLVKQLFIRRQARVSSAFTQVVMTLWKWGLYANEPSCCGGDFQDMTQLHFGNESFFWKTICSGEVHGSHDSLECIWGLFCHLLRQQYFVCCMQRALNELRQQQDAKAEKTPAMIKVTESSSCQR